MFSVRFYTMDKEFEMKILEVIGQRRESSYLGIYVMSCFASFDKEIQKILELIESKNEFASWFVGLISIFTRVPYDLVIEFCICLRIYRRFQYNFLTSNFLQVVLHIFVIRKLSISSS